LSLFNAVVELAERCPAKRRLPFQQAKRAIAPLNPQENACAP